MKADFKKWAREKDRGFIGNLIVAEIINQFAEDFAEKENAELIKMLKIAKCPNYPICDQMGAIQIDEEDWEQCQWCHEREILINQKFKDDEKAR